MTFSPVKLIQNLSIKLRLVLLFAILGIVYMVHVSMLWYAKEKFLSESNLLAQKQTTAQRYLLQTDRDCYQNNLLLGQAIAHKVLHNDSSYKRDIFLIDNNFRKAKAQLRQMAQEFGTDSLHHDLHSEFDTHFTSWKQESESILQLLKTSKTDLARLHYSGSYQESFQQTHLSLVRFIEIFKLQTARKKQNLITKNKTITTVGSILFGLFFILLVSGAYILITSITSPLGRLVEATDRISNGDLSSKIEIEGTDEIARVFTSFRKMVFILNKIVKGINKSSKALLQASNELSNVAGIITDNSSVQAASAEEVSTSVEEMQVTIGQNSDNAQNTNKLAKHSAADIQLATNKAENTSANMTSITAKVKAITDIAAQTDMLAINAAIEAARAGTHGKGFGVVAIEVRKLAENTKEVSDMIVTLAEENTHNAFESKSVLALAADEVKATADLINDITQSSIEQKISASQISESIQHLNQVIQQNSSTADQLASSSELLAKHAKSLTRNIDFFTTR